MAAAWASYTNLYTSRYPEALAEGQISPSPPVVARAYLKSGDIDNAKKTVASLRELSKSRFVSAYRIALAYTALDDNEQAFEWLERAFEDRSMRADFMKVDPWFDNLRGDRRFASLMHRGGLQP